MMTSYRNKCFIQSQWFHWHHCPSSLQATVNHTEGKGNKQIKGLTSVTELLSVLSFFGSSQVSITTTPHLLSQVYHFQRWLTRKQHSVLPLCCSAAGNSLLSWVTPVCTVHRAAEYIFSWYRNSMWGNCELQESCVIENSRIGKEEELDPL